MKKKVLHSISNLVKGFNINYLLGIGILLLFLIPLADMLHKLNAYRDFSFYAFFLLTLFVIIASIKTFLDE